MILLLLLLILCIVVAIPFIKEWRRQEAYEKKLREEHNKLEESGYYER